MRETLGEQRKSDKEEWERDREFFMQLGKEVNNMPFFFFSENLLMAMY